MELFARYPKIKLLGHKDNEDIFLNPGDVIVIEEKMDGANFRFMINKNRIIFGSRTQQITSDEGKDDNVAKNFRRCLDYIREQIKGVDLTDYKKVIFYGECMVKHTLEYDWDKIPPFLGFDIFDITSDKFMNRAEYKTMYKNLKLKCVSCIDIVNSSDITQFEDKNIPLSEYAPLSNPSQKAEGVVFKNQITGMRAKYVRTEFKEESRETFGISAKFAKDDTEKVVAKYCVNPRIDKGIFKLIDEGHKLEMALMKQLPKFIYQDIIEEHGTDILFSKMTINFMQLNKQITRRCLKVLQQVIINNALSKGE